MHRRIWQKLIRGLVIRPGAIAVAAIFVLISVAAFNTGENLLYLIGACAGSFLISAFLLTPLSLRGLQIHRDVPASAFRGVPFASKVRIENKKSWLPSFSLRVEDPSNSGLLKGYAAKISAGASATMQLEEILPRRGVHALPGMTISSGFPLGLVRRQATHHDTASVVVYPRVVKLQRNVVEQLDDSGGAPRPLDHGGDEFFALREYVPGDDIRYICWRVSARIGRLIVRELEPATARMLVIVFDTRGVPETLELEEQFEESVDLVASLAMMFLERQFGVAVVTPDASIELGKGDAHARKLLEMLAHVQPATDGAHSDDWFSASGDLGGAARVYVASDPARWGGQVGNRGVRVLDPREVMNA